MLDTRTNAAILVVDDDMILLETLKEELQAAFNSVDTARDSKTALQMLKQKDYDCVVTDYLMSEMNGLELIDKINHLYPSIPTILLTGNGSNSTVLNSIEKGLFDFVDKPFRAPLLIHRIRNSLLMPKIERLITEIAKHEFPDLKISKLAQMSHLDRLKAMEALEATIFTRLLNKSKKVSA